MTRYYKALTYKRFTDDGWSRSLGTAQNGDGFIQQVSGNEDFTHIATNQRITARLYCPVELSIAYGDIVTQDGISYSVLYADQPTGISGTGHHKEILLGAAV